MDFISEDGSGLTSRVTTRATSWATVGREESPRASSPQRPICSRRRPYIPAAVHAPMAPSADFRQPRYYRHFTCRRRLPLAARLTFLGSRDCFGHTFCRSAVADNTLTIKQKSTLPVSKTRQDKSLFRSLSGAYPPPLESGFCVCRPALQPPRHHGLPPHLRHYYPPPVSAYARHPFYMTTCAAATAACGPGAKMSSRTPQGRFLYRTVQRGRPVRQKA